jgi:hypothetical protein
MMSTVCGPSHPDIALWSLQLISLLAPLPKIGAQ